MRFRSQVLGSQTRLLLVSSSPLELGFIYIVDRLIFSEDTIYTKTYVRP